MITNKQLNTLINNKGGNLMDGNITYFKRGYSVSIMDGEIFDLRRDSEKKIIDYIDMHFKDSCGLWVDGEKLYIDYSINIASLDRALEIAKRFNQLAIYDCENNQSIYLDEVK